MSRALRGPLWLLIAAVALGLLAWRLGLDRSDKLASIGSCILALIALAAAAGTYLRPGPHEEPVAHRVAEPPPSAAATVPAPTASDPTAHQPPAPAATNWYVTNNNPRNAITGSGNETEINVGRPRRAPRGRRGRATPPESS